MEEVWKIIDGYNSDFAVSNLGRIKSLARVVSNHTGVIHKPERILKQQIDHKGYCRVSLHKRKALAVHRLVAFAFIPQVAGKNQINHIDGNKQNNCVDNLEWCNNSENAIHAIKTGLNDHTKYHSGRPYRPIFQIDLKTGLIIKRFNSITEAKNEVSPGTKSNNIGMVCRGERKLAYGYGWKYAE